MNRKLLAGLSAAVLLLLTVAMSAGGAQQPFTVASTLAGKQVLPHRVHWQASANATASVKNGQIVFRGFHRLFVVSPDGRGVRKLTAPKGHDVDDQPDWSPDGSTVAFQRCSDVCHVWAIGSNGTRLRRLGPAADDRAEPAWAPSGKQLAYTRAWGPVQNDQIEHTELYVMNANGGATRQLTEITASAPFSADVIGATWSPDGKQVAFEVKNSGKGEPADRHAVFIVGSAGGDPRQLTPWSLNGASPDWSPDGRLIVFRAVSAKQQHGNVYTIHPDGSGLKRLTNYPSPKALESPSFSPDGNWIVFSRFSPEKGAYPSIFVMRIDGTGVRRVTHADKTNGFAHFAPAWGASR